MLELSELKPEIVLAATHKSYLGEELNEVEREYASIVNEWAAEIGRKGKDTDCEIAAFIQQTLSPVIAELDDTLLDKLFERGTIPEFDAFKLLRSPKNTLIAYDCAKGGNVKKSYIDYEEFAPTTRHEQVETKITYADLRRDGFKSISTLTAYAEETLRYKMFKALMTAVNNGVTSDLTNQYFTCSGALTAAVADKFALYLTDRNPSGSFTLSLSKYKQELSKLGGGTIMSESMKNELHNYGFLSVYQGVKLGSISSAVEIEGTPVIPDKVVLGFAGKIGVLKQRGEVRILETLDNNQEAVDIKVTGFEFDYCITRPENIAKIVIS